MLGGIDHYAMKLRPLAKLLYFLSFGVAMNLLHCRCPLLGGLGLELVFRQIFQFQNVAVLYFGVAL